jgi:hypothetical protein
MIHPSYFSAFFHLSPEAREAIRKNQNLVVQLREKTGAGFSQKREEELREDVLKSYLDLDKKIPLYEVPLSEGGSLVISGTNDLRRFAEFLKQP